MEFTLLTHVEGEFYIFATKTHISETQAHVLYTLELES